MAFTINGDAQALINAIDEYEVETAEKHKVATGLKDAVKKFGNVDLLQGDSLNEVLQPMYAATTDLHSRPEVEKIYSKLNAVVNQILSINSVAQESKRFWRESNASSAANAVIETAMAAQLHEGGAKEAQRIRDLLAQHPAVPAVPAA